MELPKRCILRNVFFKSQCNYCPTIWMFHNRSLNNKINRLHERCLRIIYKDKHSNFEELLNKDNSVSIHHNSVHALALEMHKVANSISLKIMNEVFKLKGNPHYNLQHTSQFSVDPIHSVYNVAESAFYLGPKIWELIPSEIRNKESLKGLKRGIKKWKPIDCPCRICKTFELRFYINSTSYCRNGSGTLAAC